MSAETKAPARRLLATYRTQPEAAAAAVWWAGPPERASGVQVAEGGKGTTPERPWAVTADKTSAGGGA